MSISHAVTEGLRPAIDTRGDTALVLEVALLGGIFVVLYAVARIYSLRRPWKAVIPAATRAAVTACTAR